MCCYSGVPYWVGNHEKRERRGRYVQTAREEEQVPVEIPGNRGVGMGKNKCICSPTIHPGSFRCRHHHAQYKWVIGTKTNNHFAASVAKSL